MKKLYLFIVLLCFAIGGLQAQTNDDQKKIVYEIVKQIQPLDRSNLNQNNQFVIYVLDNEFHPKTEINYIDIEFQYVKAEDLKGKSYLEFSTIDFTDEKLVHVIYKYFLNGKELEHKMLELKKENHLWKITQETIFE